MTELQEQIKLFKWAKEIPLLQDLLIAIPNGGYRLPREAAMLKRSGVRAGVSDIFLPLPTPVHAGLWIELKRTGKKAIVSKSQKDWLDLMAQQNYCTSVCYGAEEAKEAILIYMETRKDA